MPYQVKMLRFFGLLHYDTKDDSLAQVSAILP